MNAETRTRQTNALDRRGTLRDLRHYTQDFPLEHLQIIDTRQETAKHCAGIRRGKLEARLPE